MNPQRLLANQRDQLQREIRPVEEAFVRHFEWVHQHIRDGDQKDSAMGKDAQLGNSYFTYLYDKIQQLPEKALLNCLMLSLAHFGFYSSFLNLQSLVDLERLEGEHCKIQRRLNSLNTLKEFDEEAYQPIPAVEKAVDFHRRLILCKLDVERTVECLRRCRVLEDDVLDEIKILPSRSSQVDQLLSHLIPNGYGALFCDLLIQSGQFDLFAFVAGSLPDEGLKTLEENANPRRLSLSAYWNDLENISPYSDIQPSTSANPSGYLDIIVDQADAATELRVYRSNKAHVYKNFSAPKGLCMVINNREFSVHPERHGTDVDEENITKLFSKMGYQVETFRNLTAAQLISSAKQFGQRSEHHRSHSTIVVVLTHGEYDELIGVDGNSVRLHEEFLYYFSAHMAPGLAGKPKLFFIQACRGHANDPGRRVSLPVDYQDGKGKLRTKTDGILSSLARGLSLRSSTPTSPVQEPIQCMKLPASLIKSKKLQRTQEISMPTCYSTNSFNSPLVETKMPIMADFLVAYSTTPGFVSWRNALNGTWFIQSICEIFAKQAAHDDILDLLTKVNRRVAQVYESTNDKMKQIPEFSSRLQRKFYFYPGVISDE